MDDKPLPKPNCPPAIRIMDHVPMAHVADVDRSVAFYAILGFSCDSRFSGDDGVTNFASISSGQARLMFARAGEPVVPGQQAVLFYMYAADVGALRAHLLDNNLTDAGQPPSLRDPAADSSRIPCGPSVFEIIHPFYMPDGELRIHDPDGYCVLVGQLECRVNPKAV